MNAPLKRAVATVLLLAVASCSDPIGGNPSAEPSAPTSRSTSFSPTTQSAPPVDNPASLNPYLQRPCDLLPREALGKFELGAEIRKFEEGDQEVASCRLFDAIDFAGISLTLYEASLVGSPLVMAYQFEKSSTVFEPLEISGFPAVQYGSGKAERRCTVAVGTDHNQGFRIAYEPGETPPGEFSENCELAVAAAEIVLATLTA